MFLESIKFFQKVEESEFSIFSNIFTKFQNEIVFFQIKEIHVKKNHEKEMKIKGEKPVQRYSLYKVVDLFKNGKNFAELLKTTHENKTEEKPPTNKYSNMIEIIMKKKSDQESKEKEFNEKIKNCLLSYEKEELIKFFQTIHEDHLIKNKIFYDKGENFSKLVQYEENILNYFLKEINEKQNYKKIKNSEFELLYKKGEKEGDLTLYFEKELNIDVVDLISLIYEVSIYTKWFPFTTVSENVFQFSKAKKLIYMINDIPLLANRDFLVYGFGVNRIKENRTILLLCKSVDDVSDIFKEHVQKKANPKFVRADIKIFGYEITILERNKLLVKG
jgi:hypothetical protein